MTGERVRTAGIALGVVFGVLAWVCIRVAIHARDQSRPDHPLTVNFAFAPEMSVLLIPIAVLLPLLLWQDEDPVRRLYHWSMPVSRPMHALVRTLAGWIWLMLVTLFFLAGIVLIREVTQWITGRPQSYGLGFSWWVWLVPITSVTITYAYASAATIATRRPFVWIAGIPLLYVALDFALWELEFRGIWHEWIRLAAGHYGILAAIAGVVHEPTQLFVFTKWCIATAIWGSVAALLFWLVSHRRD